MDLPINYEKSHWRVRKQARLKYIELQEGICIYCKKPLDGDPDPTIQETPINLRLFPKGMLDNPIHLHHCHKTGLSLGAIHARCNAVLWQYFKQ